MASTSQAKSLEDRIRMWNIEGIHGSTALKLNLKLPEQ